MSVNGSNNDKEENDFDDKKIIFTSIIRSGIPQSAWNICNNNTHESTFTNAPLITNPDLKLSWTLDLREPTEEELRQQRRLINRLRRAVRERYGLYTWRLRRMAYIARHGSPDGGWDD